MKLISLALATLLCMVCSPLSAADKIPATKPNIFFFLAEDWGRNASCYRGPAQPSVTDVIDKPPSFDWHTVIATIGGTTSAKTWVWSVCVQPL